MGVRRKLVSWAICVSKAADQNYSLYVKPTKQIEFTVDCMDLH